MNWEPSVYPFGFENGLNLRGVNVLNSAPDRVRWVSSVRGANGNPGTFKRPKSTIANALDTAEANDLILVDPNHDETVTGVGGWTADVAGVEVVGLGRQGRRPRILCDGAATVTLAVTGEGVCFRNIQFRAGHADVATCFDVDAESFALIGCDFVDHASGENFLAIVTSGSATDNVCDYMHLVGNKWHSPDAACTNLLVHTGHLDHMVVAGNIVTLPAGTASQLIESVSGDLFRGAFICWNFLFHAMTADELFILNGGSTNSGIIAHNRVGHADVTGAHDLGIDGLGCRLFDNLSVSTDALSGVILPAADVDL